eukprot:CAMPEP_0170627332 /NCGR_PEP_ID=MMETSP0224-20130122/31916_1 /TAXON_ID=285029 /ORGANISM="Togula jolla, Strain CCCM 725" /LENGTH=34 /DNA_ID= /DNA_START= /DNA_END= /DNA_ORIENTATION=
MQTGGAGNEQKGSRESHEALEGCWALPSWPYESR